MKNSLLTIALAGWLAFGQTAQAQPQHVPDKAEPVQTTQASQPASPQSQVQMAQISSQMESALSTSHAAEADEKGSMPSVPIGLAGLFLMLCALVKRHQN